MTKLVKRHSPFQDGSRVCHLTDCWEVNVVEIFSHFNPALILVEELLLDDVCDDCSSLILVDITDGTVGDSAGQPQPGH